MMFFFYLIFILLKIENNIADKIECETFYIFKSVCHFYDFESDNNLCHPSNLSLCEVFRTTFDESRCPHYECIVSSNKNKFIF